MPDKNKILILVAGGTITCGHNEKGSLAPSQQVVERLLDRVPSLIPEPSSHYSYDVVMMDPLIDSACAKPKDWLRIANTVMTEGQDYSKIIILHGTDTLVYTASALSLLLPPLGKQIILTASQRHPDAEGTDAYSNLSQAIAAAIAMEDEPVIATLFAGKLMQAGRIHKHSAEDLAAFHADNGGGLGYFDGQNFIRNSAEKAFEGGNNTGALPEKIRNSVHCLTLRPTTTAKSLKSAAESDKLRIVILEGYGTGNGPEQPKLFKLIKKLAERGIPVFMTTQAAHGAVSIGTYAAGASYAEAGVIGLGDMKTATAVVKACIGSSLYKGEKDLVRYMLHNVAGEVSPETIVVPDKYKRPRKFQTAPIISAP